MSIRKKLLTGTAALMAFLCLGSLARAQIVEIELPFDVEGFKVAGSDLEWAKIDQADHLKCSEVNAWAAAKHLRFATQPEVEKLLDQIIYEEGVGSRSVKKIGGRYEYSSGYDMGSIQVIGVISIGPPRKVTDRYPERHPDRDATFVKITELGMASRLYFDDTERKRRDVRAEGGPHVPLHTYSNKIALRENDIKEDGKCAGVFLVRK